MKRSFWSRNRSLYQIDKSCLLASSTKNSYVNGSGIVQIQEEQAAGVLAILFCNSVALVPSWEVEHIKLSLSSEEGSERVSAKPLKEYMVTTWI